MATPTRHVVSDSPALLDVCVDDVSNTVQHLKAYINEIVVNDKHTSIPRPLVARHTCSKDIGTQSYPGGDDSDVAVPVVLRVEYPPGAQPRHAVICVKPSIPAYNFDVMIERVFGTVQDSGIIVKRVPLWLGSCPFVPGAPTTKTSGTIHLMTAPTLNQLIEELGKNKNGIIEVHLKKAPDCIMCCNKPAIGDLDMIEMGRRSTEATQLLCPECFVEVYDIEITPDT